MKIDYNERFIKDLKKLKKLPIYGHIVKYAFEELPACAAVDDIRHLKKIRGYQTYYRIRIGDYRIGLKIEDQNMTLMRVLHRKDVYRFFP